MITWFIIIIYLVMLLSLIATCFGLIIYFYFKAEINDTKKL